MLIARSRVRNLRERIDGKMRGNLCLSKDERANRSEPKAHPTKVIQAFLMQRHFPRHFPTDIFVPIFLHARERDAFPNAANRSLQEFPEFYSTNNKENSAKRTARDLMKGKGKGNTYIIFEAI